jgi:transcriptional regulator with XRE-family HTH domain
MARPKLSDEEKKLRVDERKNIGNQIRAAIDRFVSDHANTSKAQLARTLGITPQHLDRITSGRIGPPDPVLARAAHFFNMALEFRGHTFGPQSFRPPSSPFDGESAKQLDLKFDEAVQLNGVDVQMRVVEKNENHWRLEIWLVNGPKQALKTDLRRPKQLESIDRKIDQISDSLERNK